MNIYEKLVRIRDMVSIDTDPIFWRDRALALGQILEQSFANKIEKDAIPKTLTIVKSDLTDSELKSLFYELDLEVDKIIIKHIDEINHLVDYQIFLR